MRHNLAHPIESNLALVRRKKELSLLPCIGLPNYDQNWSGDKQVISVSFSTLATKPFSATIRPELIWESDHVLKLFVSLYWHKTFWPVTLFYVWYSLYFLVCSKSNQVDIYALKPLGTLLLSGTYSTYSICYVTKTKWPELTSYFHQTN